ncbi:MAG: hypothetical protein RLZZ124_63 [Cyanobacteriota bacterium]
MKRAPLAPAWSAPLHRSRQGSSHRRRGTPCQDASIGVTVRAADGIPATLMAVADGHGGQRYWLSDVGSRLACRVAIDLARRDLTRRRLGPALDPGGLEQWKQWLAVDLPERIVQGWRSAVAADWEERQRSGQGREESFSHATYGSTLGLVVMTPRWWAHTGLGDWDLVLLEGGGRAELVSQEEASVGPGEATESLCLPDAGRCFAGRTAIHALPARATTPLGLVLSTDGLRKSCATDDDHLALARFLAAELTGAGSGGGVVSPQLDASLDHISSEGSGDDVSVALACWGDALGLIEAQPAERSPSSSLSTAAGDRPPGQAVAQDVGPAPPGAPSPDTPGSTRRPRRPGRRPAAWRPWAGLLGVAIVILAAVGLTPLVLRRRAAAPAPAPSELDRRATSTTADAATMAAMASVHQLYRDLATQRFQAARRRLTPGFARTFDPEGYRRYGAISVSELRFAGRKGRTVFLRGIVSLDAVDGGRRIEERWFRVDTTSTPALLSGSELIPPGSRAGRIDQTSGTAALSIHPTAQGLRDAEGEAKRRPRNPAANATR